MKYKLDDIDIRTYGAIPYVEHSKECMALTGVFDLPKRKGTTEYNWESSIEPYVDAGDIELDGRTLTLSLCIKAADYKDKLSVLKAACISCKKLGTEFGEFEVILKDGISVDEYIILNMAIVKIKFWQQIYFPVEIMLTPTGGISYMLDEYNLQQDFGILISSRSRFENLEKRIEVSTTKPYTQTVYREARDITFQCIMRGRNLFELYEKMSQFQAVCIAPGTRRLCLRENETIDLYFKNGITVTARTERLLEFSLKCRVVG